MIFNQFGFLFIFLPLVLVLFNMPGLSRVRPYMLVAASFVFYGLSGLEHAVVLGADILWVYFVTRSQRVMKSRRFLVAAITPPVLALFYYKYLGFFLNEVIGRSLLPISGGRGFEMFTSVVLPAGISFFTFQLVSFAIDRYRGRVPEMPPFRNFSLYISFFPQLVAGPILRFREVDTPLARLTGYRPDKDAWSRAIGYICIGLGLKVLVADTLSRCIMNYLVQPDRLTVTASVYTILAYSFQIYFDFYGYSLIAIGLGALFGFKFPDNFRHPYGAPNPRDFWRRWHVTLSYWIRDYLYLPLGGNKAYAKNILIVFAVCGLWHGAGWTFIIWGIYHAFLVIGYHALKDFWDRMPRRIQITGNFSLVSLGWLLFLFDFDELSLFMGSLLGQAESGLANPDPGMWVALIAAAVVCFCPSLEPVAENRSSTTLRAFLRNSALALVFVVTLVFLDRSETFIYFRF